RLSLGAAWLAGEAPALGSASARWLEMSLALAQVFSLSPSLQVTAGLSSALTSVRLDPRLASGGVSPVGDWSARAGVLARLEQGVARTVLLGIGPDLGAVLHPLTAVGSDGTPHRIGGVWLGGTFAVTLDPDAAPIRR